MNDENGSSAGTQWDSLKNEVEFVPDVVERSAEKLKEQAIDMTTAEEGVLASDFESGVYLFHSSEVRGIKEILESGELLNAGEFREFTLDTEVSAEQYSVEEIYIMDDFDQPGGHRRSDFRRPKEVFKIKDQKDLPAVIEAVKKRMQELDQKRHATP